MKAEMNIDDKLQLLIDIDDLCELTRLSQSTIYRKMNPKDRRFDATFPMPVDIGVNNNFWRYEDVKNWVANRPMRVAA